MTALRVVATPIGNVSDLSPRATEALATAAVILAEDTRHSGALLDRLGIKVRLVSCHAHNELERVKVAVERLDAGEAVALITDAGAPAISDPGGRLIAEVVAAGHRVEVFPGPSAPVAALMGAGLDVSRYTFLGFLPRKGARREALLDMAASTGFAAVVFESANRTRATLGDLHEALGARPVVVARELTKLHETFHRGVLGDELAPPLVDKGEVVIVVGPGAPKAAASEVDVDAILKDTSAPPRARAKQLAKALGISTKEAYARVTAAGPQAAHERLLEHLAKAARALVEVAGGADPLEGLSAEIDGADELLALLANKPLAVAAPVEAEETAKAILGALSAADALVEAMEMMEAVERARGARDD